MIRVNLAAYRRVDPSNDICIQVKIRFVFLFRMMTSYVFHGEEGVYQSLNLQPLLSIMQPERYRGDFCVLITSYICSIT